MTAYSSKKMVITPIISQLFLLVGLLENPYLSNDEKLKLMKKMKLHPKNLVKKLTEYNKG